MLRFVIARDLCVIIKWSQYLAAKGFAKRQVNSFLPQSGLCFQTVNIHTNNPARKDAPDSSEGRETIDLDKWKTVMKLKAAPEEQLQVDDKVEASDEETDRGLTLEATRELVTMWRHAGKLVPQEMTDEELQTLADLPTKSSRKKYLKYLAIKEGHKTARKEKQQKKRALLEQKGQLEAEEEHNEPELKNSFILQFWNRSLDKLLAWRSAQAMIFGQPLIYDFSYEANMSKREVENTVTQLMDVEAWNRRAIDPFHLHFCNLQSDSFYKEHLLKRYGAETWDRLLITSTDRQHIEVFPRERLVYLTADSPNVLRTYDHSKVYIIGALVDRSVQLGLSLANAKRLKLATARLPLDEFLYWETGAKNLTLDQMFRIMLTLKETGKWEDALKFVPTRKHDGFHQHQPKNKQMQMKRGNAHKSGDKHFNSSVKDFLMDSEKNTPAVNRLQTMKSNVQRRQNTGRNRHWWDDE